MHSAVGVFLFLFIYKMKDLLSLCLIRPLYAGCTDPVFQTLLVSWIQPDCKPPDKGHSLHSAKHLCCAVPLHVMTERVIHGAVSLRKKNNFTDHFSMSSNIEHSSMVGLHTIQTRMPQSSIIQMTPILEAGHRHRSAHSPLQRTWMARTKQVFQRCLPGTEIKKKGQRCSAHPVYWETVKRNASSAGGVRISNQSRISRESWVAD